SPEVSRRRGPLRLRGDLENALDEARAAPRNLQQLSPVLCGPAEAGRHRGTRGALHEVVRRADIRDAQGRRRREDGEDQKAAGWRDEVVLPPEGGSHESRIVSAGRVFRPRTSIATEQVAFIFSGDLFLQARQS